MLIVVGGAAYAAGMRGFLLILVAFVGSGVMSFFVLRGPRTQLGNDVGGFFKRINDRIDAATADKALAMLDVDPQGFDVMDRKLLEAVIHRFDGGPVGLDNVAAAIGEEAGTIEDVIEPYLIQQGYLQRTPRGRIATLAAYRHLGVAPPKTGSGLFEA